MGKVYGCVRPLYEGEKLDKQIKAIKAAYPEAEIRIERSFTGIFLELENGDMLVFDSVIRMSDSIGVAKMTYVSCYGAGDELVFLREPYLNTKLRRQAEKDKDEAAMKGIDAFIDVQFADAHLRAMEAFRQSRERAKSYKRRGGVKGRTLNVKKKEPAMDYIKKHSRSFDGIEYDRYIMEDINISPNTYYKYKKELKKLYPNSKK